MIPNKKRDLWAQPIVILKIAFIAGLKLLNALKPFGANESIIKDYGNGKFFGITYRKIY